MGKTETWRELIQEEMDLFGETFDNVTHMTLSSKDLDKEFNSSWGRPEGKEFTLWTEARVYFPVVYDGSEWCRSVPRNPCDEKTKHIGGW